MSRILFESPFLLCIALIPVLLAAVGWWNVTRSPASRRTMLAVLLAIPLLFVLQSMVVTTREKLEQTLQHLANHVEAGDIPAIMVLISPHAQFTGGMNRIQFKDWVEVILRKYDVREPSVHIIELKLQGERAEVVTTGNCSVTAEGWSHMIPSKWRLNLEFSDQQWLITDLVPIEIAETPYRSLESIY
ncbi:MAG: hypothetical protein HJJLKODD_00981 [Phycisphaerae bacterium]|nr:hypothetical protein [Phycisphaerae bacterium]